MITKDDEDGKIGTKIGREVMETAGKALKANITTIGPLVLPLSEKLIFVGNLFARKARLRPKTLQRVPHVPCPPARCLRAHLVAGVHEAHLRGQTWWRARRIFCLMRSCLL